MTDERPPLPAFLDPNKEFIWDFVRGKDYHTAGLRYGKVFPIWRLDIGQWTYIPSTDRNTTITNLRRYLKAQSISSGLIIKSACYEAYIYRLS